MTRKFSELRQESQSDPERRARVVHFKKAMRDIIKLTELREARSTTQRDLANAMSVSQARISKIEHENDLYISTLENYVASLGGELRIEAIFPDQTIQLTRTEQSP